MNNNQEALDKQKEDINTLKKYRFRAIVFNCAFLILFIVSAILSVFENTSIAGFIMCCVLSVTWTALYGLVAHEQLFKIKKSYAYVYIIIAAIVCGFTFFSFYICPKPQLNINLNGGSSTWNDIIPFVIGIKMICDAGLAFNKGIRFF